MLDLTSLNAPKLEITSISGLEHATNLRSLSIWNNQISDISPLTNLTSLTGLYIGSNQISDISPLANLVNLKRLGMLRNQISDISVLAGLVNLKYLKLAENSITDTSSVVNLPKLSNVDIEIPSIIPDANLRTAVREALDLEENLRITPNAMKNLSTLNAPKLGITSISGLEHATNLRSLSIGNNQISDISPLTDLTSLTGLYIGSNQISDISPLANLVNLKRLGMLRNQISDISVLAGLVNLESLKLAGNPITDTSVLANLPKLSDVDIEIDQSPQTELPQDEKPPKDEPPQVDPNRAPVTVGTISGRTLTAAGASVSVDVSSNFQDPDNDNMSFSAASNDVDVVTVSVAGAEVTLTPHSAGSAIVTVTANDGALTATQTIAVTVTAAPVANRAPVTVGAISARTQTAAGASVIVDVSDNFEDPDNDNLSYSASSDNTDIVTVSVSGTQVTLTPYSAGSAVVTVTASDGELTATQTITVSVVVPNRAPVAVGAISARTLTAGGASVRVNVSANFQDPDNDDLSYSVSSDNTGIVSVSVSNSLVTLTPVGAGNAVVTVMASDGKLTATQSISVSVVAANRAPVAVGAISARTLTVGDSLVVVDVSTNFQDPDNDDLSYSASSENTDLATVSVADALVTLTPVGAGNAVVTVTASDGKLTATQTISVTVTAAPVANRAPVTVGAISARTLTAAGDSVVVDVSGSFEDPDDDDLSYSVSSDNTDVATASLSGSQVTITPVAEGSVTIAVVASDGKLTATQTISVSVAAPNRSPVAVGTISSRTLISEGSSEQVDVSSNFRDPDDDTLTYTVNSSDTDIATVSMAGSLVTITPVGVGNASVTVIANDGELTATQSISVSVAAPNRAPVAVGTISAYTLIAGGSVVRVDVAGNFEDPDDNTLTYTASSDETSVATVSISGSLVTITPEGAGDATITVTASDNELTTTQSISVSVAAPNRAPVAVGTISAYTLMAGGSVVRVDVAENFEDPDDNTLTYTASSDDTSIATVSVSGALVTITPEGTGDATITVTASDGELTATQNISVSVAAPNRAPVAIGTISSYTLIAGGSVVRVDVASNFEDPDDNTLTYTASSDDTSVATVSISGSLVTITPEGAGDATITVTASDGELTATQSISVSVAAPNRSPVAVGTISAYTLMAGGSVVRVDVVGNFEDPDDNTLTYTASSDDTSIATVSVSGALVTITPEGTGDATITVTASDGELTATQNISVSVAAANRSPVAVGTISADTLTAGDSSVQIDVAGNFSDPDDDTLTYTASSDDTSVATVSVSGSLVTITPEGTGDATITVTASDGELTATQTFSVSVDADKPGVSITVPSGVENDEFDVTITFTEPVSDFEQSDVSFTGTAGVTITEWSANTEKTVFTATLKPTKSGKMILKVDEGVATDAANNPNTASAEQQIEIDITQPDVSISVDLQKERGIFGHYVVNRAFDATITFTEAVSGFEQADVWAECDSDSDITITGFEVVDAMTYTVEVSPGAPEASHREDVTIVVRSGVATDAAGNPNTRGESVEIVFEFSRPAPTITVIDDDTDASKFRARIGFGSEDMLGFDQSDLSLANSTASATITSWSSQTETVEQGIFNPYSAVFYYAEITATTSGVVRLSIAENVATDLAGNGNTAATPVNVTITIPGSDPPETSNLDTTSPSVSISVDLQKERGIFGHYVVNRAFDATITFTEAVSGFEQADVWAECDSDSDITITGFEVVDAMTYTVEVSPGAPEASHREDVTIVVRSGVATDAAGNPNTRGESVEIVFEFSRPAPTITVIDDDTDASKFRARIGFGSEDMLGFDQSDLSLANSTASATITSWSSQTETVEQGIFNPYSAVFYYAEITATTSGVVRLSIAENVATDLAGNGNTAATPVNVTITIPGSDPPETSNLDTTSPSVSISVDLQKERGIFGHYVVNRAFDATITFTEAVSGFEQADVWAECDSDSDITITGFEVVDAMTYTVEVSPGTPEASHREDVTIVVQSGVATDAAGNPNTKGESVEVVFEFSRPAPTITVIDDDTDASKFRARIGFGSEDMLGFDQSDLSLANSTASATITSWSSQTETVEQGIFNPYSAVFYYAEITATTSGVVRLSIAENVATDLAGNGNTAAVQKTVTITLSDNQGSAPLASVSKADFVLDPAVLKTLNRDALVDQLNILRVKSNGSAKYLRTIRLIESILATMRPDKTQLLANYPNPFNPETWIPYHLANPSNVQITIYNARGNVVRRLALGHQRAGYYTSRSRAAYWDGTNSFGERVSSGIYFYQLAADNKSLLRKMLILK